MNYIQNSTTKKVKAIYTLLENDIKQESKITIEQYNDEIDIALAEIKANKVLAHKEVAKLSKNW